jgi:hypothetical protein
MQPNMSVAPVTSTALPPIFNSDEDARKMSPPQFTSTSPWGSSVEEEGPNESWYLCLGLDTIETRNEEQSKYTVLFVEPRRTELSYK